MSANQLLDNPWITVRHSLIHQRSFSSSYFNEKLLLGDFDLQGDNNMPPPNAMDVMLHDFLKQRDQTSSEDIPVADGDQVKHSKE